MKRSTDKGVTWTEKNLTSQATSSKLSYMDPTVVVDQVTGKIFLFTSLWDAVGKESAKQGYNNRAVSYTHLDVYKRQGFMSPVAGIIADRVNRKWLRCV